MNPTKLKARAIENGVELTVAWTENADTDTPSYFTRYFKIPRDVAEDLAAALLTEATGHPCRISPRQPGTCGAIEEPHRCAKPEGHPSIQAHGYRLGEGWAPFDD